jgi:hypothetical protein
MGAWGVGTFENDDACDFAAEVAKSSNLSKMEDALDRVLKAGNEYIEAPEATEALAAAEIVTRLAGRAGEKTAYTEEIDKWVDKNKDGSAGFAARKGAPLRGSHYGGAIRTLELCMESDESDAWKKSANELMSRL